jgi:hypothetical protein
VARVTGIIDLVDAGAVLEAAAPHVSITEAGAMR